LQCVYSDTLVAADCIDACRRDSSCIGTEIAYTNGNISTPGKCEVHRSFVLQPMPLLCYSYNNTLDEFIPVGDPTKSQACRTLSEEDETGYGHDTSVRVTDTSFPDCQSICRNESNCKGIEYKGLTRICELHFLSVDYADVHFCYLRIMPEIAQYNADYTASVTKYQGYEGDYEVSGSISVARSSEEDTLMILTYSLMGLESNTSGSLMIHEETSCDGDLQYEFVNPEKYDIPNGDYNPWYGPTWVSDEYGVSKGSVAVNAGYSVSESKGHAVVVQVSDGTYASCGILEEIYSVQSKLDAMEQKFNIALIVSIAIASVFVIFLLVCSCMTQKGETPNEKNTTQEQEGFLQSA